MSETKHTKGTLRAGTMAMSAKEWASLRCKEMDVVQRGQDVIAVVWCGDDVEGGEQANASRLALAWNCHDDLVAALKKAEVWLEGWASAEAELAIIRAALAKASHSLGDSAS
jgi:hypothetical protein